MRLAKLPYGPQLCRLVLKPACCLRASIDDLKTYFHQLKAPPGAHWRNVVGREFDGAGFERFGGRAGVLGRLALTVVPMGDLNAVDVAQATRWHALHAGGCLAEDTELIYGQVIPKGPL